MDWIEVTARTVDDAKELALDRLGVVEDELEYEVLDEARSGFIGIGRTDARIRARVKPISREKPQDRRKRRRGPERTSRSRSGTRSSSSGETSTDGNGRSGGQGEQGGGDRAPSNRRRRGGRGRSGSGSRPAATSAAVATDNVTEAAGAEVPVETKPVAEQAEQAAKFTEELVRSMGFDGTVETSIDGDDITVNIQGEGLGPLVGPKGATLRSLEEVVRAVVQHHAGGHSAWVHVDVSGYRERRRAALAEFARNVAEEVRESGVAKAIEPMPAADRKVVHDVITEIDGVATTSEGEEPRRRVVIRPE